MRLRNVSFGADNGLFVELRLSDDMKTMDVTAVLPEFIRDRGILSLAPLY